MNILILQLFFKQKYKTFPGSSFLNDLLLFVVIYGSKWRIFGLLVRPKKQFEAIILSSEEHFYT